MSVYVEYEDGKPDYSLMGNPTTIKAVDVGSVSMHDPGPYGMYRDATSTDLAKYGYVGDSIALISEVGAVMKFVSDTGFFSCQSIIDMLVDVYTFEACQATLHELERFCSSRIHLFRRPRLCR